MAKYYIIEKNYTGPDQAKHVDADKIDIRTLPEYTNKSYEKRVEGWCGTTNDWAVYAHGEYDTIEEARAAIAAEFGEVRGGDNEGNRFESDDESVVETYKPGKYAPISSRAALDWVYDDIQADTTDERMSELLAEYEAEANFNGYTFDSGLRDIMRSRRDELHDEMDDDYYR